MPTYGNINRFWSPNVRYICNFSIKGGVIMWEYGVIAKTLCFEKKVYFN